MLFRSLFLFAFYRSANRLLLFLISFIAVGLVLFVILFFQALRDHDYYTLDMLILIPFVALAFFLLLKSRFNRLYSSLLFRIALLAFLIHNVDFARRRMNDRYDPTIWQNENYNRVKVFEEIMPYMRSIGIKQEDRVMSLSDESIDISLYLMNQKGWTNYGIASDSTKIREKIKMGAKYLFIYDRSIYRDGKIGAFTKNKIGEFKTVDIFKL